MRRRLLVGGAALVAALAILALVGLPTHHLPPSTPPVPASPEPPVPEGVPVATSSAQRVAPPPAPREPVAAWREADIDAETQLPPYKEVVAGRALVRVSSVLRSLDVGDPIAIAVPQLGETWRTVVEEVERGPGAARSLIGALTESGGRRHEFVVTTGNRYVFAWLDTPAGTYELVAPGELGWLMPSVNMDQHVDYSQPDYYIPGRDDPRNSFGERPRPDEPGYPRSGRRP